MGAEQQLKIRKLTFRVKELELEVVDLKSQLATKTEIAEIYGKQRDDLTEQVNRLLQQREERHV